MEPYREAAYKRISLPLTNFPVPVLRAEGVEIFRPKLFLFLSLLWFTLKLLHDQRVSEGRLEENAITLKGRYNG